MSSWHIYALGGGWGHLTRAVSLARAAARRGIEIEILANSPWADRLLGLGVWKDHASIRRLIDLPPEIRFRILPSEASFAETSRLAAEWVSGIQDGTLIVDTFPRGLGGELAEIIPRMTTPRVWVHRDLDPHYARDYDLESFARHFELVILPGEDAPLAHLPQARRTAPWMIAETSELLSREDARGTLGLNGDRPVVAVSGSGTPVEAGESGQLAARLREELADLAEVAWISPLPGPLEVGGVTPLAIWPLLVVLRGVDVLVGSGGYHTVHEARAAGVPLLALPQPRKYDRQIHRLSENEAVVSPEQFGERIRETLRGRVERAKEVSFVNGASAAADWIGRLSAHGVSNSLRE